MRQIWARQNAKRYFAIDNLRQRNRVLVPAKEALSAINRIERPKGVSNFACSSSNPCTDVFGRGGRVKMVNVSDDAFQKRRVCLERRCILFRHDNGFW